ncbi:MAG: trypsin-like peptidase domain-containing protein [Oscillospiraceae bacterium]|nr:trypsin-like peptidase domain-containing protein [Oscillospiraceae bacterium]
MESFENVPLSGQETPPPVSSVAPEGGDKEALPQVGTPSPAPDLPPAVRETFPQAETPPEPVPVSVDTAPPPEPVPVSVSVDTAPPPEPVPVSADTTKPTHAAEMSPESSYKPRRTRKKQRNYWFLGFLCGMALAGALAVGGRLWERYHAQNFTDRFFWDFREDYNDNSREDLEIKIPTWPVGDGPVFTLLREHGDTQTAQEVYKNVNPSVVTVIVGLDEKTAAVGTGVIFSTDGYFVTNYHVVQGGTECRAMLHSGHSYRAFYVAGDEQNDLAILKMDCSDVLPAAQFGDSELLTVGDDVYAIGNPLGIEFRGTLTNGIISAIDRDVLVDGRTMTLIQTNAALNSGNSGGPLINQYGQVVGINVVKMSSRRSTVEGLGFAIPSASMERLVNDLLTYGKSQPEPMIGVSVDSFGTEVEPGLWGIGVLKVEPDSPAEKAGVQVGDYIIVADTETVASSRDLLRARRRYHVGEAMPLTLWRDGQRVEVLIAFTE